jgi:3-deoxy-7-phosphoheptulonate synthase
MESISLNNINIRAFTQLIKPNILQSQLPLNSKSKYHVFRTREIIADILNNNDKRLLFIVGPCSIHNIDEAYEYGKKLKELSLKVEDKILIVMRVYFEKPRTTIGWKGLINDPDLDNTFNINNGLYMARKLLLDLNNIGLPCGCEILDTITPQYICDLISWGAIGARTTESQVHRQLVSGLSMPVGFKNGTNGNVKICYDAIKSSKYPHCFIGINNNGEVGICHTNGNKCAHIILRGGNNGPNYDKDNIDRIENDENYKKLETKIMIDCSHGNSCKNFRNQPEVFKNVTEQIKNQKNNTIIGLMLESNLNEGNQKLDIENINNLEKGVSITDGCINFETTEKLIIDFYNSLD